jgi:cyclic pyranopterin phosphate synthase
MIDRFGRTIEYLRLSVTERCTLRCVYCRADEGICPKAEELSSGEFFRIAKACAALGIKKVRLTGGEPLLRKDILDIIRDLDSIELIDEITMTTNGQMLAAQAEKLKQAGLDRINVSLDTLDPVRYREITGGEIDAVLAGIDEAIRSQLLPVKINIVLVKGRNDDEVDDFIALTQNRPIDVRIIELMPLGEMEWDGSMKVSNDDLIAARPYLQPVPSYYSGQPSRDFRVEGHLGRVGFISPISHRFCNECNRIRIMSDGMLRPCLGQNEEISLKDALAAGDEVLEETIRTAIYDKPAGHLFENGFIPAKTMSRIGG